MSLCELTIETDGAAPRLALSGELDIASAGEVEQALVGLEQDAAVVVLDLRELSFLDSTGLRIILAADERARASGRRLVIVRGPEAVQRIFHMTRLDERLDIVEDPAAALPS